MNFSESVKLFICVSSIIYLILHVTQFHLTPIISFTITLFISHFILKFPSFISFFLALFISYLIFDVRNIYLKNRNKKDNLPKIENFDNKDIPDPKIDLSKTVINAMQNLTPSQIENMSKETKQLVATQKELMSVIKDLTPVVKNGMELMSNFGDINDGGLLNMFKKVQDSTIDLSKKDKKIKK